MPWPHSESAPQAALSMVSVGSPPPPLLLLLPHATATNAANAKVPNRPNALICVSKDRSRQIAVAQRERTETVRAMLVSTGTL
jgi:hypothetical protein